MRNHETGKRVAPRRPLPTRRLLSLLMALVMSLSLVQITALATGETGGAEKTPAEIQADKQITNAGGTVYYDAAGKEVKETEDWAVKLTRTLSATGHENYFDVNMEVTTRDKIDSADAEAAAVLVIDTSGSMANCAVCGKGEGDKAHKGKVEYKCPGNRNTTWEEGWFGECRNCHHRFWDHKRVETEGEHAYQSRLELAKLAAKSFVASFAQNAAGQTATASRYVAIVSFDTYANTRQTLVDVTKGTTEVENAINALKADGGTNTEAGLQLASNLLGQKSAVENRFVVLLTDGLPTYYIENHKDNRRDGLEKVPSGYNVTKYDIFGRYDEWHDGVVGKGNATSSDETAPVERVSKALKTDGVKVYGVTYGVTQQIPNGNNVKKNIDKWMTEDCQMAGVYSVNDPNALNAAFSAILNTIQHETVGTTIATSVHNANVIGTLPGLYTFAAFINQNGAEVADNDNVTWDLSKAKAEETTSTTEKTYKMSYKVQMHTEVENFAKETSYPLGTATLSYKVNDKNVGPVAFPNVAAKGYLGALTFTKVDSADNAKKLDGAIFVLAEAGKEFSYLDVSKNGGVVSFGGIPSGYAYNLTETKAPEGYVKTGKTWSVSVNYGAVTVTENVEGGEAEPFNPATVNFQVVNTKQPDPKPEKVTYRVEYYLEKTYGYDKTPDYAVNGERETVGQITIQGLYEAGFESVLAGYLFDAETTDINNYPLSDGTVVPGKQVEVEDGDVFKLYYELDTSEPVTDYVDYVIEYYYRDSPTGTYVLAEEETIRSDENTRVRRGDSLGVPGTIRTGYTLDANVDGGSTPGMYTLTADETTFKLYYTMEEQSETSLTYTVRYFYRDSDTAEYVEETAESYSGSAKEGVVLTVNAGAKSGYTFTKGDKPGTYNLTAAKHNFELYYTKQSSEPIIDPPVTPTYNYYTVTVNYYDKDSGVLLQQYTSPSQLEYTTYDVTARDKIAIEGYTYVETNGDALTGTLNGNKVINVYYTKDTTPVDPPVTPVDPPVTPVDPPVTPVDPPVTPVDPAPVDPPKTGDAMTFWVAAAAASALGLAALALTGKKRREEV